MKLARLMCGAAVGVLALAGMSSAASAAAGDECVKVLGYEWSGEKQSMDPADMHSGDDAYHTFAVYNRLVDIDDNFKVLPELATEWKVSDDGLTWTFKLRDGVKFHSGKDFSSADVVYTFKRLLDEKTGSGARAVLEFLDPDGIKAPDARTVTFTTKKPVVELPVLISNKFTNIVPDGAKAEDLRLHEDGTGPFVQEEFTPNAPVRILRKNPNYWDKSKPKAECLKITVAQEAVAAVSAMKSGEVDLMLNVDPSVIPALKDDPNITLLQTAASNSMTISFWVDTKPFDNVKVREALKAVVDRQAMVDTVLLGFGEPGADNPVPVGNPASYVKEAPKQDYELAKKLLAEAGYKDGLKFDLYTAEGVPGMVRMAQVYAEMAKPAGIDINVIVTPAESFWDDVWLKKPAETSAWSMRPPGEGLAVAYVQTAKWKETHWERPDYDALLLKANTTVDPAERTKVFQQTGELLAKEGGLVLPMFVHQVLALRKGCEGYTPRAQNFNLNFEDLSCGK
ncbi:MAG TPA: ABC transporter substrate-binding protein [Dongiaceae bacterium]